MNYALRTEQLKSRREGEREMDGDSEMKRERNNAVQVERK